MAMHPPPPLHTLSPRQAEESIYLSTFEHAASPGECSNVGHFFISPSPPRNIVQTTTHEDVFPLRRAESPSLAFNHVGRRLCLAKHVDDTLPVSGRALVYCCLPRPPFVHKQTTSHVSAQKISKGAAPSAPPPLQFYHPPPSPGAPLNNIQCVRSRSRADIEGRTGGFKVINIIFLASRC